MVAITVGVQSGGRLAGQVQCTGLIGGSRRILERQAANVTQVLQILQFLVRDFEPEQVNVVLKRQCAARVARDAGGDA